MGKRKTGLGANPLTGLNWIKPTGGRSALRSKQEAKEIQKLRTSRVPKFRTFEVKLTVLLRKDQLEFLEELSREIMAKRDSFHKRERITKNTILRVFIDALKELHIDKENIADEEGLLKRIRNKLGNF